MAHKKGQGSSRNGRDSNSQRLGVKRFGGEQVRGGSIILRQHGTKWKAGTNVGLAKDHSLFAKLGGRVRFDGTRFFHDHAPSDPALVSLAPDQVRALGAFLELL